MSSDLNAGGPSAAAPSAAEFYQELLATLRSADDLASIIRRHPSAPPGAIDDCGGVEWTNALLNIVIRLGTQRGYVCWPSAYYFRKTGDKNSISCAQGDRPERLVDAAWTHYPKRDAWLAMLRQGRSVRAPRLTLVCESEWIAGEGPILDDFAKLADVRAPLKVLFFSFQEKGYTAGFDDIVRLCAVAAAPVPVDESYVLIGWPQICAWADRVERHKVRFLSEAGLATAPIPGISVDGE